jgi:hypothetical protein
MIKTLSGTNMEAFLKNVHYLSEEATVISAVTMFTLEYMDRSCLYYTWNEKYFLNISKNRCFAVWIRKQVQKFEWYFECNVPGTHVPFIFTNSPMHSHMRIPFPELQVWFAPHGFVWHISMAIQHVREMLFHTRHWVKY